MQSGTPEFGYSKRGRRLIVMNGYSFYHKKDHNGKVRWQCSTHSSKGCKAVIHTIDDVIVFSKLNHSHAPTKNWIRGELF
ncbi:hypothetical protein B5X24_HaOG203957 [Helicoverpa armigera]|uniref:FLYWCH-type domain-containing protein n=1 Tax=Helicoverpa armigera TaxID=29058 RepID=A0A2W1BWF7_HELAM|nr:hypothetical protein B5X24_HaOG203957 [Helicoverpa armigera]